MAYPEQMTQGIGVVDYILPTNAAAASYNSANPINMAQFKRALYIIDVGVVASGGTLDARLQSSKTSNFATAHNLTGGLNITQITASNTIVTLEVRADQVTQQNAGDVFVRLNTTVGTAAIFYSAIGLGGEAAQKPAGTNFNPTIVAQQLACTT